MESAKHLTVMHLMCVPRCVLCTLPVVPGAVRHPPVPPGDLTGTVHQPWRGQRLENHLPVIWRYTYVIMLSTDYFRLQLIFSLDRPLTHNVTPLTATTNELMIKHGFIRWQRLSALWFETWKMSLFYFPFFFMVFKIICKLPHVFVKQVNQ